MFAKNDISGLMKQAQQMQEKIKQAQEELAQVVVEGQAGAGMVVVKMTCTHVVKNIAIKDDSVLADKEMLEDLLAAAFNDAVLKAEKITQEKMAAFSSGFSL